MQRIIFKYPFMVFQKCDCSKQNHIDEITVDENGNGYTLTTDITCSTCGAQIQRSHKVSEKTVDLSSDINAFKIIPSIKDEVALVKLDSLKEKIKNGKLFFFGNYSHLRFFDNVIQEDTIPIYYQKHFL